MSGPLPSRCRVGRLTSSRLGRVAEPRHLRELVEREHTLPPLITHDPGWVGLHRYLPAEIGTGIDPLRVALHIRHLVRGRPEPGLSHSTYGTSSAAGPNR